MSPVKTAATDVRPILEIWDLSKAYPGTQALDKVSIHLNKREILGLAGHNGAGKSTLTRILAGAEPPDSGEILLDGLPIRFKSPDEAIMHGIGLVPQPLMVVPNLTGRENLLLGAHRRLWPSRDAQATSWYGQSDSAAGAIADLAEHLGLSPYLDLKVSRLRPVTQRLLMIGRALLRSPRVLILDEPTSNLPYDDVERLFAILRPLVQRSASLIYISHRLDEMLQLTDRVVTLRQGRVIAEKQSAATSKVELSALIAGSDLSQELQSLASEVDISAQVHAVPARGNGNRELLRCENLTALPSTRGVSFSLHGGQVLGLAGLDGSGRSSLLRALWGDRRCTGGRLLLRGREIRIRHPRQAIAAGMAYLPEERAYNALFPGMTVAENVTLPSLSKFSLRVSGLIKMQTEQSQVETLLKRLDLRPLHGAVRTKIKAFSGGNQQKAIIARWLLRDADIFMFDEPTQGIDVGAKEQVYEVIRELAQRGAGVILASSEPEELARLCDNVLIMRDGMIAQVLTGQGVTEESIQRATMEAVAG